MVVEQHIVRLRGLLGALRTLVIAVEVVQSDFAAQALGTMTFLIAEAEAAVDAIEAEVVPAPGEASND